MAEQTLVETKEIEKCTICGTVLYVGSGECFNCKFEKIEKGINKKVNCGTCKVPEADGYCGFKHLGIKCGS